MSKELFISASPHETKVAVLEDDSLVEVFYQRDTDVGLVGGIYKGRVSRVLPGMQSAFVDIGLERDAFLYVSDFFEDSDEYDRVVTDAESRVGKRATVEVPTSPAESSATDEPGASGAAAAVPAAASERATESGSLGAAAEPSAAEPALPAAQSLPSALPSGGGSSAAADSQGSPSHRWQASRGRGRRRRRGRGFGGNEPSNAFRPAEPASSDPPGLEILPGESLAKYAQSSAEAAAPEASTLGTMPERESSGQDAGVSSAAGLVESRGLASQSSPSAPTSVGARELESAPPEPTSGKPERRPEEADSSDEEPSDESVEAELLAGDLRVAPVWFEPDAPAHHLGSSVEDDSDKARSGEEDTGREPGASSPETVESGESAAEDGTGAEVGEGIDSSAEIQVVSTDTDGQAAEATEDSDDGEQAAASAEDAVPGPPADETGERSYTLRDSQQRPRFAPRRGRRGGRGRFGARDSRQHGGPRRMGHPRGGNEQSVQINEVLKEGQEILVQIAKEPLGTKGARITSHIALPGRYLVYMPTIRHIGVSRKIGSEEERLRLRSVILENRALLPGGVIVRTAAAGRSDDELKGDIEFLARLWNEIRERNERSKAPALIHRDLTLVERILRDILSPQFKTVRTDSDLEYQNILDFVNRFQPSLVGHVKLYTKDTPMFEEFGIQAEIDKALKPKVWLKSGGYIVINQTEALVAIDVNTGKYVGRTNRLEDTIVKTNIDAVNEIVRQVRLRDLGGIVVIDFIDMDDRRNRAKVVQALEEALRADRAPTKILSFNEFGLVALTRKRVKQSLERTLSEQCPYCTGSGWIKSVTTVCYEILEEARKMAGEIEGEVLTLRVNPEVARALKSREGALTAELESMAGKDVIIKSDPTVHHERYEIF
jgi:ribonuclease G